MVRLVLIAVLGCSGLTGQSASVNQLETEAQQLLAAKDASGALAKYRELARLAPDSVPYQDKIGFILAARNIPIKPSLISSMPSNSIQSLLRATITSAWPSG
jgi:hypothetical protein